MEAEEKVGPRWRRRPLGSNWGDFGPDDQIGRMNLITPERRLAAVAEVKEGLAFMLSLPLDHPRDVDPNATRRPPRLQAATRPDGVAWYNLPQGMGAADPCGVVCDDSVQLWTQFSTQWDSLAHWGHRFDADGDGMAETVYYNGYRAHEHLRGPTPDAGPYARALGIENLAETGVQGRAVVVSLLAEFGPGRTLVGYEKLMQAMDAQGAEAGPGDFLLLHNGIDDAILAGTDLATLRTMGAVIDGRDLRLQDWIRDRGIVAIASDDRAIEGIFPDDASGAHSMLPLHDLCLFKLGVHLGEMWRLGELSRWLFARRRTRCLLTAPPLRLPGAVGSPVTPIATV